MAELMFVPTFREKIDDIMGTKCCVCGYTRPKNRKRFPLHEVSGKQHDYNPSYILNHVEDFVRLCRKCHDGLHTYHTNKIMFERLERLFSS